MTSRKRLSEPLLTSVEADESTGEFLTLDQIDAGLPPFRNEYEHTVAELTKRGLHPKNGVDGWEIVPEHDGKRRVMFGNKIITCTCWRKRA